jgi:mono/diheme cytochrome c family protein
MKGALRIGFGITVTIAAFAIGIVLFVESGVYDIGADDHHTKLVLAIIEQLRDRSIAAHATTIDVPSLEDPKGIAGGARRYAALCVGCHLAPGVTKSDLRMGLYPHPPNLAQTDAPDAQKSFWTIKHGIKMSAMPAWGKSLDDEAIWDLVAFVRQVPTMTPETFQQLAQPRTERVDAISWESSYRLSGRQADATRAGKPMRRHRS